MVLLDLRMHRAGVDHRRITREARTNATLSPLRSRWPAPRRALCPWPSSARFVGEAACSRTLSELASHGKATPSPTVRFAAAACSRKRRSRFRPHDERVAAVDDAVDVHIGTEVSGIGCLTGAIARLQRVARVNKAVSVGVADENAHRALNAVAVISRKTKRVGEPSPRRKRDGVFARRSVPSYCE